MKPVHVKSSTNIDFSEEKMIKILNLKLVIMLKYKKHFCKRFQFKLIRRSFCDCKSKNYCTVDLCNRGP